MSGITKNAKDLGSVFLITILRMFLLTETQKFVAAHHALGHAPTNFQKI